MLRKRPYLLDLLEIAVILGFLLIFTQQTRTEFLADTIPPGAEYPYLINSGALASATFQQNGAIPLWNPLMGRGEPLFESLFSYLLNPLMTYPILFGGVIEGGKVAILLHLVVMALGGWALGRSLKLHAGAVLLGLLLGASGGFTTALNRGFYQIALSLAYMAWVYAGLIGLLYREHTRRWLGVLVVALTLMLFAGTYWYVIPVLIGCTAIALFALIKPEAPGIRALRFKRLVLAGAFFTGFAALSLIPRLNSYLVYHPAQGLDSETYDLGAILASFFVPDKLTTADWWFAYQYLIPAWFAGGVVLVRLLLAWLGSPFARWRILIPTALVILFFCVWAQDNTPLFQFIYAHSFLIQWRWPARMAMAAAPFVALGVALWFDEIVALLLRRNLVFKLGAVAVIGVGLYAASLVYWNWDNLFHFDPQTRDSAEYLGLVRLRDDYPGAFVPVTTEGLIPHVAIHDLLIRSSFGNPDVFTFGLPSEPAFEGALNWAAPFAIGIHEGYENGLRFLGYVPYSDPPLDEGGNPALWVKPDALPYAFVVQREALARNADTVTRGIVDPVTSMAHHLDRIEFAVDAYKFNSVLVVQEVDYPGWTVTVDGQPTEIESFDGALAVSLPLNAHEVVFTYHAPLLVVGLIVFVITLVLFAIYLLRLDRFIAGTRFDPARLWARRRRAPEIAS